MGMLDLMQSEEGESMTQVTTVGIDLAKNIFQLHGVDRHGKAVLASTLHA